MSEPRNRLGDEKSPYLLQHQDNPVHWYPWGEEAFAAARRRDAPIFLSVGYSTCHWCHVMERESFEDHEVASLLNDRFVAIKVDREERPDIDAIYMDAVQALTRSGGWPMSVFLTHDGRPFFGGTYFPREQFVGLLKRIDDVWSNQREQVEEQGAGLSRMLSAMGEQARAGNLDPALFGTFFEAWQQQFDGVFGGRLGSPKFPPASDLRVLLRIHRRSGNESALTIVRKTLDAMARGGIYDHLGGGFARYSTDRRWLVPHFEKMLYDQASLTLAYAEAYQVTGDDEYAAVVRETCDYVLRDMTHPAGGFYSAEDADSEGEEGKFYVWSATELGRLLTEEEFRLVADAYGVSEHGNFEKQTNILNLQSGHTRTGRSPALKGALHKLFAARAKRVRPHLDDKILTDWNGLMIAAMARAGRVLDEPRYVAGAADAARFVLSRLASSEGRLLHRWRDGEAGIRGFLEDYSYLIGGLIELYQADFDPVWLTKAVELQRVQDELFRDSAGGDYFSTDGSDSTVILRRNEPFDNVRPAGRSLTALNLLRLADLTVTPSLSEGASQVFRATPELARQAPAAFSDLMIALDYATDRSKQIAIVGPADGPATKAVLDALRTEFLPNVVLAAGADQAVERAVPLLSGKPTRPGTTTVYVCENATCRLPVVDPQKALELARTYRSLDLGGSPASPR